MTEIEPPPMRDRPQPDRAAVLASDRLSVLSDPLAALLLGRVRDRRTGSGEFAGLGEQIATRVLWAALGDVALRPAEAVGFDGARIETPVLAERIAGVVILRAGLLFVSPLRALLPDAPIYQVGVRRDERSLDARVYVSNLPDERDWADRVVILDPMIATGGSLCRAIEEVRRACAGRIVVASIIAAPLGIDAVLRADPDCRIFTAALDEALDEHGYIVPGLGDAGDRLFGTQGQPD